ncbi:hypothetical protein PCL_00598 [Purpureocillium lilacinum]|uniref:Uncharacterized protein n=1 Tax=Purpureocillium lilacinum TaxID=33203 RepID=A0A2U3E5C4_PURLI|nr:hypothetical protein PCL_00598 [Purpureocillium lilacinum]
MTSVRAHDPMPQRAGVHGRQEAPPLARQSGRGLVLSNGGRSPPRCIIANDTKVRHRTRLAFLDAGSACFGAAASGAVIKLESSSPVCCRWRAQRHEACRQSSWAPAPIQQTPVACSGTPTLLGSGMASAHDEKPHFSQEVSSVGTPWRNKHHRHPASDATLTGPMHAYIEIRRCTSSQQLCFPKLVASPQPGPIPDSGAFKKAAGGDRGPESALRTSPQVPRSREPRWGGSGGAPRLPLLPYTISPPQRASPLGLRAAPSEDRRSEGDNGAASLPPSFPPHRRRQLNKTVPVLCEPPHFKPPVSFLCISPYPRPPSPSSSSSRAAAGGPSPRKKAAQASQPTAAVDGKLVIDGTRDACTELELELEGAKATAPSLPSAALQTHTIRKERIRSSPSITTSALVLSCPVLSCHHHHHSTPIFSFLPPASKERGLYPPVHPILAVGGVPTPHTLSHRRRLAEATAAGGGGGGRRRNGGCHQGSSRPRTLGIPSFFSSRSTSSPRCRTSSAPSFDGYAPRRTDRTPAHRSSPHLISRPSICFAAYELRRPHLFIDDQRLELHWLSPPRKAYFHFGQTAYSRSCSPGTAHGSQVRVDSYQLTGPTHHLTHAHLGEIYTNRHHLTPHATGSLSLMCVPVGIVAKALILVAFCLSPAYAATC